MKKKENLSAQIEIDLVNLVQFGAKNAKFILVSMILFSIIFITYIQNNKTTSGYLAIALGGTKINYESLNLLKIQIPRYITLVKEKNIASTFLKNLNEIDTTPDKKITDDSMSYNENYFNALDALIDYKWIDKNVNGVSGKKPLKKENTKTISAYSLFGKSLVTSTYESILITAKGKNKEIIIAQILNAQVTLGRMKQYERFKNMVESGAIKVKKSDAINTHTINTLNLDIDNLEASIKNLENIFASAVALSTESSIPLEQLREIFEGVPAKTVPPELVIVSQNLILSQANLKKAEQELIEKKSELSKFLKNSKLTKLAFKVHKINTSFLDKQILQLKAPNFEKLASEIQLISDNLNITDNLTKTYFSGLMVKYLDFQLIGEQYKTVNPITFIETYKMPISKAGILGAVVGFFASLLFLLINIGYKQVKTALNKKN